MFDTHITTVPAPRCLGFEIVHASLLLRSVHFLGSPLGYGLRPFEVLGHSLRKASNSFFGFKRILSAPACPLKVKFVLLDTYITSRWRWLAPAAFPTVRAVDSLEAMKNTFLLSITRIRGDPFESWVRIRWQDAVHAACYANL